MQDEENRVPGEGLIFPGQYLYDRLSPRAQHRLYGCYCYCCLLGLQYHQHRGKTVYEARQTCGEHTLFILHLLVEQLKS